MHIDIITFSKIERNRIQSCFCFVWQESPSQEMWRIDGNTSQFGCNNKMNCRGSIINEFSYAHRVIL